MPGKHQVDELTEVQRSKGTGFPIVGQTALAPEETEAQVSPYGRDTVTLSDEAQEHLNQSHGHGHGHKAYGDYRNFGQYISSAAKAGVHGQNLAQIARGDVDQVFTADQLKRLGNGEVTIDQLLDEIKKAQEEEEKKKAEEEAQKQAATTSTSTSTTTASGTTAATSGTAGGQGAAGNIEPAPVTEEQP